MIKLLKQYRKGILRIAGVVTAIILIVVTIYRKPLFKYEENIKLEGYSLNVRDYGKGKPTIIIVPGLNCRSYFYYQMQFRTSFTHRVITYDNAGIGKSTPSNNPRTLPYYVKELKELLAYKNIAPPYVLVGHSLGGHIIRYFTYLYPDEVAGLVFLDHPQEDWFSYVRSTWNEDEINEYFSFWNPDINSMNYQGTGLEELAKYEDNCDSIRGKVLPADIPVLMFTGNSKSHFRKNPQLSEKDFKMWVKLQKQIIENSNDAKQVIVTDAGHILHSKKPKLVQKEFNLFLEKIEDKAP